MNTADQFSSEGFKEKAAVEYQRAIFFANEPHYLFRAHYGLGMVYRELERWQLAELEFERAVTCAPNDSLNAEATVALAATYIASGKASLALLNLLPLFHTTRKGDSCSQILLLSLIAEVQQHHWVQANALADQLELSGHNKADSSTRKLRTFLLQANEEKRCDPETAKLLSTIVPGTGQLYAGDVGNGVNAFALNFLNGWVIVNNIIQADYVSVVLYGVMIAERYYSGNRYHAEQIALKANEVMEEGFAREILEEITMSVHEHSCHN
jgi:tetratricopeptide (TPR) repeat protein